MDFDEKVVLRPLYRVLEWVTFGIFAVTAVFIILRWKSLPPIMAFHFNAAGEVDRYGRRITALIPAFLQLCLWIAVSLAVRFPSEWAVPVRVKKENLAFVRATLRLFALAMRFVLTCLLGWIEFSLIYFHPIGGIFTLVSLVIIIATIVVFAVYMRRGMV